MQKPNDLSSREIIITRLFDAPRDLVFEVWTSPQHVIHWWGPNGFKTTNHEMSVKPGGVWKFVMHGPDGIDYPNTIVFEEVIKPERLVYKHGARENDPGSFHVTITFEALGKKTHVTMRSLFNSAGERDFVVKQFGAIEGGHQTLSRFEEYLKSM